MQDKWTLDPAKILQVLVANPAVYDHFDALSLADAVALIGQVVADGPVDVDWQDRYGWTILTCSQFTRLITETTEVIFACTLKYKSMTWRIQNPKPDDLPPNLNYD